MNVVNMNPRETTVEERRKNISDEMRRDFALTERDLDRTVEKLSLLIGSASLAPKHADVSVAVAQPTLSRLSAAMGALIEARAELIAAHKEASAVERTTLGMDIGDPSI